MLKMKKYLLPVIMLAIFETVAVTLWLTMDNLFYLFNFSYIGISIALGIFLFIRKYKNARRVIQLLVGLYMLIYLGLICGENMQIEGFWYYLFTGVFEAATIHYAVGIILALVFRDNRAFCKYICPVTIFLKPMSYFALLRIKCDKSKCISCGICKKCVLWKWMLPIIPESGRMVPNIFFALNV